MQDEFPDVILVKSKNHPTKGFGSKEHTDIGNLAFHKFIEKLKGLEKNNDQKAKNFLEKLQQVLKESDQIEVYNPFYDKDNEPSRKIQFTKMLLKYSVYESYLSPGDIVALAGDFLGIPDQPIAFGVDDLDQESRFEAALGKLINVEENRVHFLEDVVAEIEADNPEDSVRSCIHCSEITWKFRKMNSVTESIAYQIEMMPDSNSLWGKIGAFASADYIPLLLKNFDHFGEDAKTAYLAGHRIARKLVSKAKQQNSNELFMQAILAELFACHFLTDLFAGGHIRTPRRELVNHLNDPSGNLKKIPNLEISTVNLALAGFFANRMHDNDGMNGIKVHIKEDKWLAKGDGNYYNIDNTKNATKVCDCMLVALEDIYRVYCEDEPVLKDLNSLNNYVPQYSLSNQVSDNGERLPAPMFYAENDKLFCGFDQDLFDKLKQQGLIDGSVYLAKEGTPFIARYLSVWLTRHFNIQFLPAAHAVIEKALDVTNATVEKLSDFYERAFVLNVNCSIM